MLGQGDKITISGINAINREGDVIDFQVSFPIEGELKIPEDLVKLSIFEYQEGPHFSGKKAFRICVGQTTSVREICEKNDMNCSFVQNSFKEIKGIDDVLCFYIGENGKKTIFARVNNEDIVVGNLEELRNVLYEISYNVENIYGSIGNIKSLSLKPRNEK